MGTIISFVSVKGGVGKTTLSLEVATSLANDFKKKVLLIDANFSAPNVGLYLDMKEKFTLHNVLKGDGGLHAAIYEAYGVDIAPASLEFNDKVDHYKLKKILDKYRSRYDFIVIDSSPHQTEMLPVVLASDRVFVVTTPDRVTLHTSMKAAELVRQSSGNVAGVIINKIKDSSYEISLKEVENTIMFPVLARIREHKKILEAGYYKSPITIYDGNNIVSKEVRRLASAIAGEKESSGFISRVFSNKIFGAEKVNREMYRQSFYESQMKSLNANFVKK